MKFTIQTQSRFSITYAVEADSVEQAEQNLRESHDFTGYEEQVCEIEQRYEGCEVLAIAPTS